MSNEIPTERQPKGDHNRRLALGIEPEAFAAEAGVTTEQLREYERTSPDHRFDAEVARRVGETLDRLEGVLPNFETGRDKPAPGASVPGVGLDAPPEEERYDGNEEVAPRYDTSGEDDAIRGNR
ncbi:hypothetical protein [Devosia naphthalenivorans]|uniref:hypothetical protein n=1 Tax=Devosia naphthalenivorans TaxID=2082392 RepID=UPI000D35A9F2|nr:hypothetical protein [Devosia naphthalenivorans]